ncbi:hypothetical protein Pcinc_027805 [Petrolisthes cinctipes]|uniref:Ionotropic glutamate receptor L-glutamate and glycine-binding domain-containing protein n=1 Tax=Petrolisthes cinctipes TaxID=88211 RepID=A0AAE1F3C9_PETCI|nr:hypothetical protein Pcinc_027805 [Petrolisthes cinctipes]
MIVVGSKLVVALLALLQSAAQSVVGTVSLNRNKNVSQSCQLGVDEMLTQLLIGPINNNGDSLLQTGQGLVLYIPPYQKDPNLCETLPTILTLQYIPLIIVQVSDGMEWAQNQPSAILGEVHLVHMALFEQDPRYFFRQVAQDIRWNPKYMILVNLDRGSAKHILRDQVFSDIKNLVLVEAGRRKLDKPVELLSYLPFASYSKFLLLGFIEPGQTRSTTSRQNGSTTSGQNGLTRSGQNGLTRSGQNGSTTSEQNGLTRSRQNGSTRSGQNGLTTSEQNGLTRSGQNGSTTNDIRSNNHGTPTPPPPPPTTTTTTTTTYQLKWTNNADKLFVDRFPSFEGNRFNLATWYLDQPYLYQSLTGPEGEGEGLSVEMLNAMSKIYNFTYDMTTVSPDEQWGMFENGSWNGMLGMIHTQDKHFTVNMFTYTRDRMRDFDASVSYWMEGFGMALMPPDSLPKWRNVYYPFSWQVWVCVGGSYVFAVAVYMVLQKIKVSTKQQQQQRRQQQQEVAEGVGVNKYKKGVGVNKYKKGIMTGVGVKKDIMTGMGVNKKDITTGMGVNKNDSMTGVDFSAWLQLLQPLLNEPLVDRIPPNNIQWHRVFLATWTLTCFILTSAYTANLIAVLSIPVYPKRIETIEELSNSDYR